MLLTTTRPYGYYTARVRQIAIRKEIGMPTTKVTVNLPDDAVESIKKIAAARGITVTEALRQLIATQDFLQTEVRKGNKVLLQDVADRSVRELVMDVGSRQP
jgi:hypothetical protein